jgi:hypothetical protein
LRISVAVLCVYFHFGSSKLMACIPCEIDNGCELLSNSICSRRNPRL